MVQARKPGEIGQPVAGQDEILQAGQAGQRLRSRDGRKLVAAQVQPENALKPDRPEMLVIWFCERNKFCRLVRPVKGWVAGMAASRLPVKSSQYNALKPERLEMLVMAFWAAARVERLAFPSRAVRSLTRLLANSDR